jgi:hypothetical protein
MLHLQVANHIVNDAGQHHGATQSSHLPQALPVPLGAFIVMITMSPR